MKQIQLALNMFVLDNEDYLPSHLRASYATDREKWEDIAQWFFMDVAQHHIYGMAIWTGTPMFSNALATGESSRKSSDGGNNPMVVGSF